MFESLGDSRPRKYWVIAPENYETTSRVCEEGKVSSKTFFLSQLFLGKQHARHAARLSAPFSRTDQHWRSRRLEAPTEPPNFRSENFV